MLLHWISSLWSMMWVLACRIGTVCRCAALVMPSGIMDMLWGSVQELCRISRLYFSVLTTENWTSDNAEENTRIVGMSFVVDAHGHMNTQDFCAWAVVKPQTNECLESVEIGSHLYTDFLGSNKWSLLACMPLCTLRPLSTFVTGSFTKEQLIFNIHICM